MLTHNILAIEQKRKRKFDMGNEAVVMTNVCKDFKVLNRHEGLKGSIKDLFSRDYKTVSAVKDVTLQLTGERSSDTWVPTAQASPRRSR